MALRVQTRTIDPDIVVVEFQGTFTFAAEESHRIEARLNQLLSEHKARLIFDLTEVERIDSMGMGILIFSFPTVRRAGARLRLVDGGGTVQREFEMTQLSKIFRVYPTVEAACQDFTITPPP